MTPQKWFVAKDYVKDVICRSLICLKHDLVLTYLNTIELRCLIEDVPKLISEIFPYFGIQSLGP